MNLEFRTVLDLHLEFFLGLVLVKFEISDLELYLTCICFILNSSNTLELVTFKARVKEVEGKFFSCDDVAEDGCSGVRAAVKIPVSEDEESIAGVDSSGESSEEEPEESWEDSIIWESSPEIDHNNDKNEKEINDETWESRKKENNLDNWKEENSKGGEYSRGFVEGDGERIGCFQNQSPKSVSPNQRRNFSPTSKEQESGVKTYGPNSKNAERKDSSQSSPIENDKVNEIADGGVILEEKKDKREEHCEEANPSTPLLGVSNKLKILLSRNTPMEEKLKSIGEDTVITEDRKNFEKKTEKENSIKARLEKKFDRERQAGYREG
ncbi:hypothetical protein L2E82_16670 [Cichorium intybus]|uniref:Uncharacterized protein n=1 Tax=Cichorium intybus TaxID=13427 RepID=A0ACB9F6S9_CICIN|nr:hypothetical protein L2E82_16670 [Cichorium intybus]